MFRPFIPLDFPILILFYEKNNGNVSGGIEFVLATLKELQLATLNVLPLATLNVLPFTHTL
jgi:hypothetical protein